MDRAPQVAERHGVTYERGTITFVCRTERKRRRKKSSIGGRFRASRLHYRCANVPHATQREFFTRSELRRRCQGLLHQSTHRNSTCPGQASVRTQIHGWGARDRNTGRRCTHRQYSVKKSTCAGERVRSRVIRAVNVSKPRRTQCPSPRSDDRNHDRLIVHVYEYGAPDLHNEVQVQDILVHARTSFPEPNFGDRKREAWLSRRE